MKKRILVIAGAVIGLLIAAYVGLSVVVYNQLSSVQADMGSTLKKQRSHQRHFHRQPGITINRSTPYPI